MAPITSTKGHAVLILGEYEPEYPSLMIRRDKELAISRDPS